MIAFTKIRIGDVMNKVIADGHIFHTAVAQICLENVEFIIMKDLKIVEEDNIDRLYLF